MNIKKTKMQKLNLSRRLITANGLIARTVVRELVLVFKSMQE